MLEVIIMKKLLALFVSFALIIGLTACSLQKDNSVSQDNGKEETLAENTAETVNIGDPVKVGDITVKFTSYEWADVIKPSDTENALRVYPNQEGEKYFVVRGTVENNGKNAYDFDGIGPFGDLTINDHYEFALWATEETLDGKNFVGAYDYLMPLQSRGFILYVNINDEVYNLAETVRLDFELSDNEGTEKPYTMILPAQK